METLPLELNIYTIPVIASVLTGFSKKFIPSKYASVVLPILAIVFSVILSFQVFSGDTMSVALTGVLLGLISTGGYDTLKDIIKPKK